MVFSKKQEKNRIFHVAVYGILIHKENTTAKATSTVIKPHIKCRMIVMDYIDELHYIQVIHIPVIAINKLNFVVNQHFSNKHHA